MFAASTGSTISLDVSTLFIVATCVASLLGLFLLSAWRQDGIRALGWWGAAYLFGGFSVSLWTMQGFGSAIIPAGLPNALLLVACAMMWTAARLFHGRDVLWIADVLRGDSMAVGVGVPELRAIEHASHCSEFTCRFELHVPDCVRALARAPQGPDQPLAGNLVPIMHGLVFLFPIPLASLLPPEMASSA